ncbi:hypothetical protein K2173_026036 [Erythroxylum novogranatense]|uniref:Tify domain-containing protein n=1 Tax=Erythroxylum novogranatense TaxID=1862640 RepID=A0AAV8SID6_9ROSI|nr:hypothetical protein K2173_026036 [Erythroxylum novogranatense]
MDSSCHFKCGSALEPSMSSVASSTSHGPPNLDLRSQVHGRISDPMFHSISGLNFSSLNRAEVGNSFLALLSGPASLLHGEFQDLSNPKSSNASSKHAIEVSSMATGTGFPPISSGMLSENANFQSLQDGLGFCPLASSKAVASSCSGSNSHLQYGLQAVNSGGQSLNLAKPVSHCLQHCNDLNDYCSLNGKWNCTLPVNTKKFQTTSVQIPQKPPFEAESSAFNNVSMSTSDCPRVYCLEISGDLLLSNTGLLGILCTCHRFHLSVSKFCEHAGLWNVNPGDAVQMDSGETISNWRKVYFHKFGQQEHWVVMFL